MVVCNGFSMYIPAAKREVACGAVIPEKHRRTEWMV